MHVVDKPRFMAQLKVVERCCLDPLDEVRQRAYWLVLAERVSIEEWEEACPAVMAQWTMHRVPMIGVFMAQIEAQRQKRLDEKRGRDQEEAHAHKKLAQLSQALLLSEPGERQAY